MRRARDRRPGTGRLFAIYAVVSLVPVIILGAVLATAIMHAARARGLAEGRSEALLVAQTAVEPQLLGHPLKQGLTSAEKLRFERIVARAVKERHVLRLRLRDLAGHVVFSDDGSGFGGKPEDEAIEAASGRVVERLTRLNSDANDVGATGIPSVEVYLPMYAGTPPRRVGVLEVYLPYAPISRDVSTGLHAVYLDLGIGLAVLYVALFAITLSVSRGLRRELAVNAYLAEHDTLTSLPNRTLFQSRAARAVSEALKQQRPSAIAILDLDRFKEVNDTLGHHNGDELLTELAHRLAGAMRPRDTVARLGGDEFGLVLRDVADPESALWRLREVLHREVDVRGLPLSVEASVGFVVAPEDGSDVSVLLQHADVAMYAAKTRHSGIERYSPSLDHHDAATLSLASELRRAIPAGELVLHYQPQAALADGSIVAVEALVRWQHPSQGLLSPGRFLPLAEQTDLIEPLTSWVLRKALSDIRDLGPAAEGLRVAVNVSARSLGRPAFAHEVMQALQEYEIPAHHLIIEVTETALLIDPRRAAVLLGRLAAAGVRISLDDFGQGQTSLAYLSELPIHELKIDRAFVGDMLENSAHAAIVRSVIDLGHNLELQVVAEGIETPAALSWLKRNGCDVAQGFLLGRPMPVNALRRCLALLSDARCAGVIRV